MWLLSGEEKEAAHAHICTNAHKPHLSVSCAGPLFRWGILSTWLITASEERPGHVCAVGKRLESVLAPTFWLTVIQQRCLLPQLWMVKDTFKHLSFHWHCSSAASCSQQITKWQSCLLSLTRRMQPAWHYHDHDVISWPHMSKKLQLCLTPQTSSCEVMQCVCSSLTSSL